MNDAAIRRYIEYFETLSPRALTRIDDVFAEDAHFRDPFNDVHGVAAIRDVFAHMYATCEDPRFTVDEWAGAAPTYYLRWHFRFGPARARRAIEGVSRVRLDAVGRALEHHDYWDPARQLYEQIPLLGRVCRALRVRLSAGRHRQATRPGQHTTNERRTEK